MTSRLPAAASPLLPVLGIGLGLAAWEAVGRSAALGRSVPPVSQVIAYLGDPANRPLFVRAATTTAIEALNGLVIGVLLAFLLAMVAVLVPSLQPGVGRLSAMVNAAPWIAMGPVFAIVYRAQTPVIISTLAVFFSCFVAFSTGFDRAAARHGRVFDAFGASRWRRVLLLALPGAVPAVVDGLRLALPAAMVGAIFGEWFGSTRGVGALLVSAMQNLRTEQLWAAAMLAGGVSLSGYVVLSGVHRLARARFL